MSGIICIEAFGVLCTEEVVYGTSQSCNWGKDLFITSGKGMTQEQLAVMLCVSPAAVSKWERNLANPSIEMLWALADYFECSIDELVGREEKTWQRSGFTIMKECGLWKWRKNCLSVVKSAEKKGCWHWMI